MERRHPTQLSVHSLANTGTRTYVSELRRRSSGKRRGVDVTVSESEAKSDARASIPPLPTPPFYQHKVKELETERSETSYLEGDGVLYHVPLTPLLEAGPSSGSSSSSSRTLMHSGCSVSLSKGPTKETRPENPPNPPRAPSGSASVRHSHSILSRGLSFLSLQSIPSSLAVLRYTKDKEEPKRRNTYTRSQQAKQGQRQNTQRRNTHKPNSHTGLPDKLTRKWPNPFTHAESIASSSTPSIIRSRSWQSSTSTLIGVNPHPHPRPGTLTVSLKNERALLQALEDGQGLGITTPATWTSFKRCMFLSVLCVFGYSLGAVWCAGMIWFRAWPLADVTYVASHDILILLTLFGLTGLISSLLGFTGLILNSRPILAVYTLLLFPTFLSLIAIGYVAYRRSAYALEDKLTFAWTHWYTAYGRLLVQNALHCCGWVSPMHEFVASGAGRCYPRTTLPGCKLGLYQYEAGWLKTVWSSVFAMVPVHLVNFVCALVCANHVTEEFGRGIVPRAYWLSGADVREVVEARRKEVEVEVVGGSK